MDLVKLRDLVDKLMSFKSIGASDELINDELFKFIYESMGGDLFSIFVRIDKLDKERIKKENDILYYGLEDAMHNMMSYSNRLNEKQPLKQIRDLNEYFFNPSDGNIAPLIRIAMSYFPDGEVHSASNNGRRFFESFLNLLLKNKDKYIGGDSERWAKDYGYYDYIEMLVKKYDNDVT